MWSFERVLHLASSNDWKVTVVWPNRTFPCLGVSHRQILFRKSEANPWNFDKASEIHGESSKHEMCASYKRWMDKSEKIVRTCCFVSLESAGIPSFALAFFKISSESNMASLKTCNDSKRIQARNNWYSNKNTTKWSAAELKKYSEFQMTNKLKSYLELTEH